MSNKKKIAFSKPPLSARDHINLMETRGLLIPDSVSAEHYLRFIGYYRLSGYALTFQKDGNKDGSHAFDGKVEFDRILNLYIFDRKLRLLVIDALERIEVAVRSCISDAMCVKHGAHWYMESKHFNATFDHPRFLQEVKSKIQFDPQTEKSPIIFVEHYYKKYSSPDLPPSWMVFELLSFGTVSQVFSRLNTENQKIISAIFCLHRKVLASWLHTLSYLRNLCAHHQRLWNRVFTIKPFVANGFESYLNPNDRLYSQLAVVQILLKKIAADSRWPRKINDLINGYNAFPASKMGFPVDWRSEPLWGLAKPKKKNAA